MPECSSCGSEAEIYNEDSDELNTIYQCPNCGNWDIVGDECDVSHVYFGRGLKCAVCGKPREDTSQKVRNVKESDLDG